MISILLWIAFWSTVFPSRVWGHAINFTLAPSTLTLLQCTPAGYAWDDLGTGPYTFVVKDASTNHTIFSNATDTPLYTWIVNAPANSTVTVGVKQSQATSITQTLGTYTVLAAQDANCLHSFAGVTSPPPDSPSTPPPTPPASSSTLAASSSSSSSTKPATTTTSLNTTLLTAFSITISLAALFFLFTLVYCYYHRRTQHWWIPQARHLREEKARAAQISPFPMDLERGQVRYTSAATTPTTGQGERRPTLPRLVIPNSLRGSFKKKQQVVQVQAQRSPSLVFKSPTESEITYLSSPGLTRQVQEEICRIRGENVLIGETIELSRG